MRSYQPGDLDTWLRIQATDPFFMPTAETFAASMPGDDAYLGSRVMFLVDPGGAEVGTITAWSSAKLTGQEIGQIHWVAIVPAACGLGLGLGKPMLSAACVAQLERGYTQAYLETNTRRVPALNLYLRFGFAPYVRNEAEEGARRAISPHLRSADGPQESP